MDSSEAWCAWFEATLPTKVSADARQKYSALLIENEIFDLETFSECIDLEPDFLSAKINVKNVALQNSIKVRLLFLLNLLTCGFSDQMFFPLRNWCKPAVPMSLLYPPSCMLPFRPRLWWTSSLLPILVAT